MGFMGKLVGGTLGFALGGPLGAIAGAAFGHAFDKNDQGYAPAESSAVQASQVTFFVAVFSMLAKIAKADGHVSKEEIDSIEKFMLYDLNLDPESRRVSVNIFQTALDSRETFDDFALQFYNHFRFEPRMTNLIIDILLRVSLADGVLSPGEEALILSAVRIFNLSENDYRRMKSRYVQDVDRYYAVLECDKNAPDEEIKKQYRKLVSDYHPDKIASKGLPEEFTKFAGDKFREIKEAYEAIKQERGRGLS